MSFLRLFPVAIIALSCSGAAAFAETISPSQAIDHVGEQVTVEGVLEQVSVISSGTIFLNYGGRYPNHIFYGVIFGDNAGAFPDLSALEGNVVALNGTIELYKGKPEIILTDPSQIEPK